MATLRLPYYPHQQDADVPYSSKAEYREYHFAYPEHRLSEYVNGICVGKDKIDLWDLPKGYQIDSLGYLAKPENTYLDMQLILREGEDNPVLGGCGFSTVSTVDVIVEALPFRIAARNLRYRTEDDLRMEMGSKLFDVICKDPRTSWNYLPRKETSILFPKAAHNKFLANLKLFASDEATRLYGEFNRGARAKGRNLLAQADKFFFPETFHVQNFVVFHLKGLSGFTGNEGGVMTKRGMVTYPNASFLAVHRWDDGWRFVLAVRGQVHEHGTLRGTSGGYPIFHLLSTFIPHEATDADRHTWRGLSLETQEYIWKISGMSKALKLALTFFEGRTKIMPRLDRWVGPPMHKLGHRFAALGAVHDHVIRVVASGRTAFYNEREDLGAVLSDVGLYLPPNQITWNHDYKISAPVARVESKTSKRAIDL